MKIPRELKRPMFIRANDYVSLAGVDYIIKRNEFNQMVKVLGRVSRKLPSEKDVIWALTARRTVACWGNKYFMFETIDHEIIEPIMQDIWEADRRRGIPIPELSKEEDIYSM
jgi:hypothetical protein